MLKKKIPESWEQSVPLGHKMSWWGRRPACLSRELLLRLQGKKKKDSSLPYKGGISILYWMRQATLPARMRSLRIFFTSVFNSQTSYGLGTEPYELEDRNGEQRIPPEFRRKWLATCCSPCTVSSPWSQMGSAQRY